MFGLQCPTSPLLPPRKAPLEDFDEYSTSANTHPHKQHLYGLLDSTMHTSHNCVTNYIHMSFASSCLDENCFVKRFEIHSVIKCEWISVCEIVTMKLSTLCFSHTSEKLYTS
ncbi:Pyridoxal-5'-phosphate-dependent enzyme family protein [Dorcoceras hygrometricum]|uniref:Pyridoxal-5'-phosphate-dependent enzyme family protein n=1 Tax=Dorcoceras hygrometricum TaxID=472368 RepID=A0A2Z7ATX6_9LAMI|nr:Pyridoxal-5'-phosphate-dependent enzyme family protein [Dorcoceras hygrometricum]